MSLADRRHLASNAFQEFGCDEPATGVRISGQVFSFGSFHGGCKIQVRSVQDWDARSWDLGIRVGGSGGDRMRSEDGQWLWTGSEWVPAPPGAAPVPMLADVQRDALSGDSDAGEPTRGELPAIARSRSRWPFLLLGSALTCLVVLALGTALYANGTLVVGLYRVAGSAAADPGQRPLVSSIPITTKASASTDVGADGNTDPSGSDGEVDSVDSSAVAYGFQKGKSIRPYATDPLPYCRGGSLGTYPRSPLSQQAFIQSCLSGFSAG